MPSNSYKISRVIETLQHRLDEQGDLDCVLVIQGEPVALNADNMLTVADLPSGRLAGPVLAFGMTMEGGVRTNLPGQRYLTDATDSDGWNHDLSAAPVATPLQIWRRFKKDDAGQVDAEGRWWVYNGGETMIECARQGVLGWRLA